MRFCCLLFLLPVLIYGSVNEPMRWEIESGYRSDSFHWHVRNAGNLTYSEHFRHLQSWENALAIRVIHRDIALYVRGSFGAFGRGSLKQRYYNLEGISDTPTFYWRPTNWTADGWGYLGYSVNLTDNRNYKVILIPFVGYGVNTENFSSRGTRVIEESSYSMNSSILGGEHTAWFGPLFGGYFLFEPGGRVHFETGYAYHRLHARFFEKRSSEITLSGHEPETSDVKIKVKEKGNLEHSGWVRMDYLCSDQWRWALTAGIQYFSSRVLDASVKGSSTPQRFKCRWTALSGAFVCSRTF